MKKTLFIVALFVSFNAHAQVYDLVRSVVIHQFTKPGTMSTNDTAESGYTQTGTLSINGNEITREFETCVNSECNHHVFRDKIFVATDKLSLIGGDSGELVSVKIISLAPNIIILQIDDEIARLEEYKPR